MTYQQMYPASPDNWNTRLFWSNIIGPHDKGS